MVTTPEWVRSADTVTRQVEALLEAELARQPEPLLTRELREVVVAVVARTLLRMEREWPHSITPDAPPHAAICGSDLR